MSDLASACVRPDASLDIYTAVFEKLATIAVVLLAASPLLGKRMRGVH